MTHLIQLATLPDELFQGYSGRLARINGFRSTKDFDKYIAEYCGCRSLFKMVSTLSGMSVVDFVKSHSMLALWKAVLSTLSNKSPEMELESDMVCFVMRASRPMLYYCEKCAREDVQFHGVSYWRRQHQIPGAYACLKHAEALRCTDWSSAYMGPATIDTHSECDSKLFEIAMTSRPVHRALDFVHEILRFNVTQQVEHVYCTLRPYLVALGVDQLSYLQARPLLGELILDSYPHEWLNESFFGGKLPVCEKKSRSEVREFFRLGAFPAFWTLVLVTTVVTDSSDDALNLWFERSIEHRARVPGLLHGEANPALIKSIKHFCHEGSASVQKSICDEYGSQMLDLVRSLAEQWLRQHQGSSFTSLSSG